MWSNKGSSPATMAGDLGSNPDTAIKKINEKEWNSGMTPEEAIKILEKKKEYSERIIDNFLSHSRGEIKDANETIEMCDMAISALKEIQQCREAVEKQKPMEIEEIHIDEYFCPACGTENCCDQGIVGDRYCPYCGQAIHQSENLEGMEDE